jgi:hypothetical protein
MHRLGIPARDRQGNPSTGNPAGVLSATRTIHRLMSDPA